LKSDFKTIGKVKSAHGIKGEIFILVFSKDVSWVKPNLEFHLNKSNNILVCKMNKFKIHKEGLIISTDQIKDRNQAEALLGAEFSVSTDLFKSEDGEALFLSEVEGFQMVDHQGADIGRVIGFSSNGLQDLLIVENQNPNSSFFKIQYEVPFVKEFVLEIDHDKQVIKTQLPEGLLEINQPGSSD
jgi:16S rRNA processing protein RimM